MTLENERPDMKVNFFVRHSNIIGALFQREMITRFGREGLGFLWVIGEPLIFCLMILLMWTLIKPAYEHGIRIGPFVMTGYSCLLLLRHQISSSIGTIQGNVGLLYHKQVKVLHLFMARNLMEFAGASCSFAIVYVVLLSLGQVGLPRDWLLLYSGWILVGLMGMGSGLILAGLAFRFEVMERIVPVLTYLLIPISGVFLMVDWLPPKWRDIYLLVPYPNAIEMVRGGVFGEFVATHYHWPYATLCAGVMIFAGMMLIADARARIDVE